MTALTRFSVPVVLPYSAITANGLASADWVFNAFQDIASQHCHELGVSGLHMAEKGLKWVIAQSTVRFHDPISWLTPLTFSTWRYPWKNLYETRRFTITDARGGLLADATGIWILIKADSCRPVRLDRNLPAELLDQPPETDPGLVKTHPPIAPEDYRARFRVLFRDMDLNQHVNNGVYLRWAMESLPHPHGLTFVPSEARVSYLKECFYPETVECLVARETTAEGLSTHHAVIRPETGDTLARIFLNWQTLPERGGRHHG